MVHIIVAVKLHQAMANMGCIKSGDNKFMVYWETTYMLILMEDIPQFPPLLDGQGFH